MTVTNEPKDTEIDIFVGSKIGSFKHVKYYTESSKNSKKCIENLVDVKTLQKDDEITCMRWGNEEQIEILIGRRNQQLQVYSTTLGITSSHTLAADAGHIVGLGRHKRLLLAGCHNGTVRVWSRKTDVEVNTGGKLDAVVLCEEEPVFGTGGEENDLKIYPIGESTPSFAAKNLSHDWLQLRRPVGVAALAFAPNEGGRVVALCSRHGYVRLYDTRAQRRPVMNVDFPNMAATCIIPSFDDRQFLVGFGRGQIQQVELRAGRPDRGYKGCVGAVTALGLRPSATGRAVVSGGLDRHLRLHDYYTKEVLYKQYLTSKISCLLVQTAGSTPLKSSEVKEEIEEIKEETDDLDTLFDKMESADDQSASEPDSKRLKPSTQGSTSEDAIAALLRSTERHKRKRDQRKREKRKKSVFYNA